MTTAVFIAHPISGDIEANLKKVLAICKEIHSNEVFPVFPSFLWRQYLNENDKDLDSKIGSVHKSYFESGFIKELWIYGDRLTKGMKKQINLAIIYKIKIIVKSQELQQPVEDFIKNEAVKIECLFFDHAKHKTSPDETKMYQGSRFNVRVNESEINSLPVNGKRSPVYEGVVDEDSVFEFVEAENLVFSQKQFEHIMANKTGTLKRMFYEGHEFTDRFKLSSEITVDDAATVFIGEIDESKIKYVDPGI